MALAVNPVLPVIASKEADSVAPDLTLEAGSVVNAQVLKVLSADLVRIAIASISDSQARCNPSRRLSYSTVEGVSAWLTEVSLGQTTKWGQAVH